MTTATARKRGSAHDAQVLARRSKPGRRPRIGSYIFLGVLSLFFIFPLWWLVIASTKSNSGLFGGSAGTLWFDKQFNFFTNIAGLSSYMGGLYWRWMLNSLVYAVAGGFGATILSVLGGYGFAKFRFRGRTAFLSAVLGAVMVPVTALTIPLFLLFSNFGLTNTVWAVILPSLLSPFGVYLMYVFCQDSVPNELLDAGRVDGAGEARIFFTIALPLMRPAVVTVLLLSVVHTWNQFFLPLVMLNDTKLLPVTVGLNLWQQQAVGSNGIIQPWNLIVTGALVSVVPLIVSFLALQRYWQGGLNLGSVK